MPGKEVRRRLRICGKVLIPRPLNGRGEAQFRLSESQIDDNLDSVTRKHDPFSLYFKGENNTFEQLAYYKIVPDRKLSDSLTLTLPFVQAKNLSLTRGGFFNVSLEIYQAKEGRHVQDIYDQPDAVEKLEIPAGSYEGKVLSKSVKLPPNTVCILITCGGRAFSGECWIEAPRLVWGGKEYIQPFTKTVNWGNSKNGWCGVNLETRCWPYWEVAVNGKSCFSGALFDRASQNADLYIPLPQGIKSGDELKLTLKDEAPRISYPYHIFRLELLEEPARAFELISMPRYLPAKSRAGILIETNKRDVELEILADRGIEPARRKMLFKEPGLHAIPLSTLSPEGKECSVKVAISDGTRTATAHSTLIVKDQDNVYLSSGDEIYIDKTEKDYPTFFKWYISQRVGNQYHFRPSYQWSGCREAGDNFARKYGSLLNGLSIPYAWQVEGRTLASARLNPSLESLATPMFRGKQAHENDGCYYYWGHFAHQGLSSDLAARVRPFGGIFAKARPIYRDYGKFVHYDPKGVQDMAHGARVFVDNLRYSRGESTRHTGPSTLFRYFYQAGYEWAGAEQMYGPEETVMSALRGASRAYGKKDYGSLHAVQWGSFPFTNSRHALRLYLSEATAYIHGSTHINTEEGHWTDEYLTDRYSISGKEHLDAHRTLLDYVETHTRRGEFTSKIAILQGRNDAWKCFGRSSIWAQHGKKWRFNQATASFDLVKIFYPDNQMNSCGPNSWFSRTPYGPIDLLPIEAPQKVMNRYQAMIFLGWNSYDENDFTRLVEFVKQGGTLLLSAAHINAELQPDLPPVFPKNDRVVKQLLGNDYASLKGLTERKLGKGKILYFPQNTYPADNGLRPAYTETIEKIAGRCVAGEEQKGWISTPDKVNFAAWDAADRRTLYVMNIDWASREPLRHADLLWGKNRFTLSIPKSPFKVVHCFDGLALSPEGNKTDILSARKTGKDWVVTVQAVEADRIRCMDRESGKEQTLPCGAGITRIKVSL